MSVYKLFIVWVCGMCIFGCASSKKVVYLEDIKCHIQKNTRMVIVTHSSNVTGEIFDVDSIGKYCKECGILFMVDAAQSAGHIPVSMENIDINIKGRHDPIIVPRAVVVVESMVAVTIVDLLFQSMTSRMDNIIKFFK